MLNRRNITRALGMLAAVLLTASALIASTAQGQSDVQTGQDVAGLAPD